MANRIRVVKVKGNNLRIGDYILRSSSRTGITGRVESMIQIEYSQNFETRVWDVSTKIGNTSARAIIFGDENVQVERTTRVKV